MIRPRPAPIAGADRNLAPAPGRPHEQQVRDVGAGDEQHEADRADQHEQGRSSTSLTIASRSGSMLKLLFGPSAFGNFCLYSAAGALHPRLGLLEATPGLRRPIARK